MDIVTLAMAKKYTKDSLEGMGAIQGKPGPKGDPGTTFTPSVSEAGVISFTNDGGLPNPDPVDIKGPKGDSGEGVPAGGADGQILAKDGSADYSTKWVDPPEGGSSEVYSTEETRIGTWVDGKPLYRRVVKATLPSGVTGTPFYTISNADEIVSYKVTAYYSSSNMYVQFPFQLDAGWGGVVVIDSGLQLRGTATSIFGNPYTAIFEYTKTTDVATIELDASERVVYAAAKAEQYSIPSPAVTASTASAEIEKI